MVKSFVSLLFALFLLIFASQNMDMARVHFVFGPPVEMPLILIISGAVVCGFLLAHINTLARRALRKRRKDGF
ncbi:MAG: LapA family protein [Magnetococcales bacterium]|nr:LapA family protein [Magnetococcales bacterium]MBF0157550.1 LapA family protein [Magnetococcales bacterium]